MKNNVKKSMSVCIVILMIFNFIPHCVKAATVSPTYQFSEAYINGIYYQNLMSVNLTGNQRIDIVNVALSQFGYHEGGYSGDFSGESTGSSNYTEYQRMPGVTSGQGMAKDAGWCAAFVSWCARQAGIPTSIIRNSTTSSITNFNITKSTIPQAGNLMFVQTDSDVNIDHTALVYDVDDTYVYSIEGNKNNRVEKRKYYRSTGKQVGYETNYIEFYGDPNYEEKTVYPPTNVTTKVWGSNVTVSWDASENATYYDVYLVQEPWGWEDIKYSHNTTSTSYIFTSVEAGDYQAFVIARPNGDTVQSKWIPFTVYNAGPESPVIKTNTTNTFVGNTIQISWDWTDNTDGFIYYLTEYPEGYAYTTNTERGDIKTNSVKFSNLGSGKYSIFVHGYNSYEWSAQSNWISFNIYEKDYIPVITTNHNGHIYAVYDYEMSWTFARDLCKDLGGHLVTINSKEENDFVVNLISKGGKDAYWIGATNIDDESKQYRWITEEEFLYENWKSGEPSCSYERGEEEHFGEIRKSYSNKWNDVNNINKNDKGFIIEIEPSENKVTATAIYGNSKYILIDANTSWTEASKYCELLGGHLAVINSNGEADAINNLINQGGREWYYLGATKENGESEWIDGNPVNYINFADNADGWNGAYLMQYKSTKNCVWLKNVYFPEYDIDRIGFICEIEMPYTDSIVEKEGNRYIIDSILYNAKEPYNIIIVGYKNNMAVTVKILPYCIDNGSCTFREDIDLVKVFVWDTSLMNPICEAEVIPQSEWVIWDE